MAEVSRLQVETALKEYVDPYLEKDLVSAGSIKDIAIDGGKVKVDVVLGFPAKGYEAELTAKLKEKSGWEVVVGPRESAGIPRFLKSL